MVEQALNTISRMWGANNFELLPSLEREFRHRGNGRRYLAFKVPTVDTVAIHENVDGEWRETKFADRLQDIVNGKKRNEQGELI